MGSSHKMKPTTKFIVFVHYSRIPFLPGSRADSGHWLGSSSLSPACSANLMVCSRASAMVY